MSYTLYHYPFSICSIMVRYTLALRGLPKDPSTAMSSITEQVIDIFNGVQLEEWYLCDVNPKGQVPALASTALEKPIADSLDITLFIARNHPQLAPEAHREEITELLRKLHGVNFFSLTFTGKPSASKGPIHRSMADDIKAIIADRRSSDRYRQALKFKLAVNEREKISALETGVPENNHKRARALLEILAGLLRLETGPWLWGLQQPTALDAHLVVLIARLTDVGREDIVPSSLKQYAASAMAGPEWQAVMQGRRTTPSPGGF